LYVVFIILSWPESFDQWWIPGKDPQKLLGKEPGGEILGRGAPYYPYIGIYNNGRIVNQRWTSGWQRPQDFGFFGFTMIGRQNLSDRFYC
jgi:hypothetical protein